MASLCFSPRTSIGGRCTTARYFPLPFSYQSLLLSLSRSVNLCALLYYLASLSLLALIVALATNLFRLFIALRSFELGRLMPHQAKLI